MVDFGIETSCDETAAAVVEAATGYVSDVVAARRPFMPVRGGSFLNCFTKTPRYIIPVIERALKEAGCPPQRLDAISGKHRAGPGRALLGTRGGKSDGLCAGYSLIPVNHLEGHIQAAFLGDEQPTPVRVPGCLRRPHRAHRSSRRNQPLLGATRGRRGREASIRSPSCSISGIRAESSSTGSPRPEIPRRFTFHAQGSTGSPSNSASAGSKPPQPILSVRTGVRQRGQPPGRMRSKTSRRVSRKPLWTCWSRRASRPPNNAAFPGLRRLGAWPRTADCARS